MSEEGARCILQFLGVQSIAWQLQPNPPLNWPRPTGKRDMMLAREHLFGWR